MGFLSTGHVGWRVNHSLIQAWQKACSHWGACNVKKKHNTWKKYVHTLVIQNMEFLSSQSMHYITKIKLSDFMDDLCNFRDWSNQDEKNCFKVIVGNLPVLAPRARCYKLGRWVPHRRRPGNAEYRSPFPTVYVAILISVWKSIEIQHSMVFNSSKIALTICLRPTGNYSGPIYS